MFLHFGQKFDMFQNNVVGMGLVFINFVELRLYFLSDYLEHKNIAP